MAAGWSSLHATSLAASYKFPAFSVSTPLNNPCHLSEHSKQKQLSYCLPDRSSASRSEEAAVMERRPVAAAGEAPPRQLPPGFRFHPTDEELIVQYLRRKVLERPLPAAVIPVVNAATMPDPWDLPGASEGEAAYFFSLRQPPSRGGGGRRRRAASGYWKATGKEKPVFVQLQQGLPGRGGSGKHLLVGVKTALAFHRGKGKARTDWVMHEYRLAGVATDLQSSAAQAPGEWVVCRVALKHRASRQAAGDDTTAAVAHREDAGDHHQPSSPSSSCVTDTCHASDSQEEVSSTCQ